MIIRRKPPAWAPVLRSRQGRATVILGVATIFVLQHLYLVAQLFHQQAAQEEDDYNLNRRDGRFRRSGGDQQQGAPLLVPSYNKNGATLYHEMKQAALKFNRPAIAKVLLEHEEFDVIIPSQNNRTLTLDDFPELVYDADQDYYDDSSEGQHFTDNVNSNDTSSKSSSSKEILDILQKAGIAVDKDVRQRLPTWQNDVVALYGDAPIVVGMETCHAFRQAVAAEDRFVGVGGQQNAGTTVLSQLLVNNLRIAQNYQVSFGMSFQLPWNKHGWLDMRGKLQEYSPYYEKIVLPVIVIRDPFVWMHSMCESPYDMVWENHNSSTSSGSGGGNVAQPHCPNLVQPHKSQVTLQESDGEPVRVSWARAFHREWHSLAHVWSEWYKEYLEQADFPRLIVRHEDLLFHAPAVLDKVRECVGAKWRHKEFVYITEPVKTTKYFTDFKAQSGMVSAMIRYGQDKTGRHRIRNMTQADLQYARRYLDKTLMKTFGYQWPSAMKDLH